MPDYQKQLDQLAQTITAIFDEKERARESAYLLHRQIIKLSGNAIKCMHRRDFQKAEQLLAEAGEAVSSLAQLGSTHPDVFYGGFVQSAQKEYVEAQVFYAIISSKPLPDMNALQVEPAPYLNGAGEAVGELRRFVLDNLRQGIFDSLDDILRMMDDIHCMLASMDYPDALTLGLRRTADVARSLIERTRGDLTAAIRSQHLEEALRKHE